MRAPRFDAGASGACGRLSLEIARLLDARDWLGGCSPKVRRLVRRRSLRIEPLEERHLMDAAGLASLVAPTWFQNVSTGDAIDHAGTARWTAEDTIVRLTDDMVSTAGRSDLYDWIVQFDTASLAGINSVAETTSLLAGSGIDFQVLRGLGLTGQVLVRSSGASIGDVEQWLGSAVHVAGFEQDALRQAEIVPNDPSVGSLWGMTTIHAQDAWTLSTGSSSVVVAVIDTGVDYTHPDLAANIWTNPGEIAGNGIDDDGNGFIDDVHGWDFLNNDCDPMDDNSHGTHVSGTIAAVGNNATGVAGVNWSSSIMALKFLGATGSGYLSDAVEAVNYATMMRSRYGVNVRVESNSWGGGGFSTAMQDAIQASNDAGILFVAAAGNSGTNNDTSPQYPANYSPANVISVAATGQNDALASFSCYGATTVDIAAPGVGIYSTVRGGGYASYSGTSMATPHVAGAAALAWSVAPNATVAQIKSAILQGADPVAALSGKVATGGRLNAYNTLQLLGAQAAQGPVVASLVASPNTVVSGAAVTLAAIGIADATATVTRVDFTLDLNNNGVYDINDRVVGVTTAVVGGEAHYTLDTTGYAAGAYRFFTLAEDSALRWSPVVSTLLTVTPPDDFGNNAASAASIGVPSSTQGSIGIQGDVDWFKFQAAAGKTYAVTTLLGSLQDSTITLYDRDGTSQLAFDDDSGGGLASKITWVAPAGGTYYLAVAAYGNSYTGTYTVSTQVHNNAPTLPALADRSMSHSQATLTVPLRASDADGDALSYTAQAVTGDPLAQSAYELQQQYGFYQWRGSYYTNLRGAGEKYIADRSGNTYFLLSDGGLYRWGGSITSSTLVATLGPAYFANPALLHDAQAPTYTPVNTANVSLGLSNGTLTITRALGYTSDFYVRVTVNDGVASASGSFKVAVTNAAPLLAPIADQSVSHRQTTLSIPLGASDADGDALSYTAQAVTCDPIAQAAYELQQANGFYQWRGSYYTNLRGAGEKYVADRSGNTFFLLSNGGLYRWGGSIASSTLLATLSPAYYNDPSLLTGARAPTATPVAGGSVNLSAAGGVLTITRDAGFAQDFQVRLTVSDGLRSVADTFNVAVTNATPQMAAVADQTMSASQNSLNLAISASDGDGDSLQYTAQALTIDPIAQRAYELQQENGFYQWRGSYYTNLRGAGEKYVANRNDTAFFILPDGGLYRWGGSIASSTLVATLSSAYYADPGLLTGAQAPSPCAVESGRVAASLVGNVLTVTRAADFCGDFYIRATVTDGLAAISRTFRVTAVAPTSFQGAALAASSLVVGSNGLGDAVPPVDTPAVDAAMALVHDRVFGRSAESSRSMEAPAATLARLMVNARDDSTPSSTRRAADERPAAASRATAFTLGSWNIARAAAGRFEAETPSAHASAAEQTAVDDYFDDLAAEVEDVYRLSL